MTRNVINDAANNKPLIYSAANSCTWSRARIATTIIEKEKAASNAMINFMFVS